MSDYVVLDPRFQALIVPHAKLEKLWTGARWGEGPVYVPAAKHLLWSDIPNDRVMRYDETSGAVSVFEHPCGYQNGHALDGQGRVVACEHGGRRISRLDHDGEWRTLADRFGGKRLNSPNDVVVKSDGSIWFTDPTYGIDSHYEGHKAPSELGVSNVYRIDGATGDITAVITDMVKPNGLAFSADEKLLFVGDTGATHVDMKRIMKVYDVSADGLSVANGRFFAESDAGFFDGFRTTTEDILWTSTADSVRAYLFDGTLIGKILIPEFVSNLTFGGRKRNRLYITAQTSLYAIYLARGAWG
ncbi:MAG: SMP-30/gluconolactonase/LRE family protein [Ancalomicrobiaceae bacterium]|nr:SMP-30/gluconolactonase/LRE family protein [Ancalomicrobiaceae bacterium]